MKNVIEKAVKTALLLAVPATFIIVAYLLHDPQKPEPIIDSFVPDDKAILQRDNSVNLSKIQAGIDKELDSIAHSPTGNLLGNFYNNFPSDSLQNTLSGQEQSDSFLMQNNKTGMSDSFALQGPSALFTHTYSLAIGKPVVVTLLWASDSVVLPTKRQLVTITLNDIADNKAGFTLADPDDVFFYSQANYATDDKILIDNENRNLEISVLEVQAEFVKIQLVSYLNDNVVSRLKKME